MAAASPRSKLAKVLVPVALVVVLGFAFWRSVHSARSEPYKIADATARRPWRLALNEVQQPGDPVLILEPPPDFSRELFDQVFKRSMESMQSPANPGIPLVYESELARAGAARPTPDALIAMARAAGLEAAPPVPRCIAHRRLPEPHTRSQAYFAIFDSPAFTTFRWNLATRLGPGFDAGAATPAVFVGVIESTLRDWIPLRADAARDCLAPIAVTP